MKEISMITPEITFSPADSERLAALTKEIQSRLDEMAAIATRLKGVAVKDGTKVKFVPREAKADFAGMHLELLDIGGQTCCVVWDSWPNPPAYLLCPCA
jgi:hypothetical protein